MLPQHVGGEIGDVHRVEGAAPGPRGAAAVRRLPLEAEHDREESVAADAVAGPETTAAMVVDDRIDVFEKAGVVPCTAG